MHPHHFRHTCALHFLRNCGDPMPGSWGVGHPTLRMVSRYAQLAAVDLKAVHASAAPPTTCGCRGADVRGMVVITQILLTFVMAGAILQKKDNCS